MDLFGIKPHSRTLTYLAAYSLTARAVYRLGSVRLPCWCGWLAWENLQKGERRNMHKFWKHTLGLVVGFGIFTVSAHAQFKNGSQPTELNIPRVSQRGTVSQRIGLTDITIVYHRPEVGGREIWGKTVPYGKVWRAGANENTTISFTDDVSVEGKSLAAGTYGLHAIPDKDQWTIIFSKNSTSWGSFSYDEKEDALRVTVKPQAADFREALAYTFEDVKPDSAAATLRWEKLAVPFHVSVDVKAVVLRTIKNELRSVGGFTWAGFDEAAQWCLDNNYNLEEALKWEETSIQNEERFENLETRSRILDVLGRKDEAAKSLSAALDKANAIQVYSYARGLQRQGNSKRAFELYPLVPKKDATHWISHLALARISSNAGDFPAAAKEMNLAITGAPDATKPFLQPMLKRLEAKDDINK
jgi:tetratricopeptide (TPR) repeat protein